MEKQEYLFDYERTAIRRVAEILAVKYTCLKLGGGEPFPAIVWTMRNTLLSCSLRTSKNHCVWLNMITSATSHNCITSKPGGLSGAIIQARFDATDFIKWIEEELTEGLTRLAIISRINAETYDNLVEMIIKKSQRASDEGTAEEILGMRFVE